MSKEFNVRSFHIKHTIDIRHFKSVYDHTPTTHTNTEAFYHLGGNRYMFVINYGAVVFYNHSDKYMEQALKKLIQMYNLKRDDFLHDDFGLLLGEGSNVRMEFNHISMPIVDQDAIKISMLNQAQSIALKYYDHVSQDLLIQVRSFTNSLEEKGKLRISKRNIMKFIGKALNTQNSIAENLYIFDSPPITWENEYYETINNTLAKHFDLNSRFRSIENTFKIIEANNHAFLELYHQKESSKLEWIIIILILVEVIDTFVTKLI